MKSKHKLPKLGFLYLDYVLRFFDKSNFKGWPDPIETVVYHWKNDQERFINEVKQKKIDILIGNIPATAYETFREIALALPHVRFVPSLETQFSNKSKENVTLFCTKNNLSIPKTKIFYDKEEGLSYLKNCKYPKIIKRSYGPSNYGGYFVHKVDSAKEALKLMKIKKYYPLYIQECIPLKADIRVMLIGHKPVCAFWRVAGKGQWITNTSQGGYMNYSGVPMGALELAVAASKAAKAEFWACDIAQAGDSFYILECATAFAAFPYIRDWIGQYLMWDFSAGAFPIPKIPLYSWEELGKIKSSLLRTMRHLSLSNQYNPSADGMIYTENKDCFEMEKTAFSSPDDIPENYFLKEHALPLEIIESCEKNACNSDFLAQSELVEIDKATLTDLMCLQGVDNEMATEILEFVKTNHITHLDELEKMDNIDLQLLKTWRDKMESKEIHLNKASALEMNQIKGVSKKLAQKIIAYRTKNGDFKVVEDLLCVKGIGQKKFKKIGDSFYV